jgi:hypothetical protein
MCAFLVAALTIVPTSAALAAAADDATPAATTASLPPSGSISATPADASMEAELYAIIHAQGFAPKWSALPATGAVPATVADARAIPDVLTSAGAADRAGHDVEARYGITAVVDPERGLVRGRMHISTHGCLNFDRVELRLRPRIGLIDDASLVVTSARLLSSSPLPSATVQMSPLGDACTIVHRALAPGGMNDIDLDWKAKLSNTGGGGGLDASGDAGAVLYHWYPELARRDAHGAWVPVTATTIPPDVALADATFTLAVPVGWDVAGAFGATAAISADGKYREYRWRNPLCRQNAIAIGHFASATCAVGAGADGITLQSWWLPGDENGGRRALAAAAQAIDHDSALLGPYPFRHLDIVDADVDEPGFAADGLILLPQRDYPALLRPKQAAKDLPDDLVTFALDGIARRWWSGVIGTDAAREPWLAEGLAGWCTVDSTAALAGAPTAATVLEDRLAEFRENTQDHDVVLDQDPSAYAGDHYAAMRDKGTLVLVVLQARLGDAVFRAFLGDLAQVRYGEALDGARFRAALAKRIGTPAADAFYARWIHGGALDMAAFTGITRAERAAASASAAAPVVNQDIPAHR